MCIFLTMGLIVKVGMATLIVDRGGESCIVYGSVMMYKIAHHHAFIASIVITRWMLASCACMEMSECVLI